jgi:aryl-alcohol dehydrogenase (NADP+)
LGSIVVDDEETTWVRRRDFLQLLDACTGELGVTYLDSAQGYQKSEESIGQWLRGKPAGFRDTLVIGSKVSARPTTREVVRTIGRQSMEKLQCGVIDIYWTHGPDPVTPVLETYRGFNDLCEEGVIREIGMCNVAPEQITEILNECRAHGLKPPTYVQNEFNLLNFESELATTALCRSEGLKYMAFSPLAGGILTGKYDPHAALPPHSRWGAWQKTRGLPDYWNADAFRALDRLKERSAEWGVSVAGIALAWCRHHEGVSTTLLGPKHTGHLNAVRDALAFAPTKTQMQEVTDLFS